MGKPKSNGRRDPAMVVLTRRQAEQRADERAQRILGVASRAEAFRKLDAGELDGTAAADVFSGLRHLLGE
jgi:hypothetical protein